MLVIIILGFTIVLAGWLTGEVMRWPFLSIPCCLVAIVSVGIVSYGFGRLAAWTDTSIRITGAADTFFETTVKCLDAGEDAKVHEELRRLDDVNWTKRLND